MLLPTLSALANVRAVLEGLHWPGQSADDASGCVLRALEDAGFSGDPDRPVAELTRAGPGGAAWTCGGCGESIEPQFAVCWKCGHAHD